MTIGTATAGATRTRLAAWMIATATIVVALAWLDVLLAALAVIAVAGSAWTVAAAWGAATPPVALPPNGGAA
ncbi:MAG: hypothetical protein ACRCY9_15775, partial [Phycicoccus sp.]